MRHFRLRYFRVGAALLALALAGCANGQAAPGSISSSFAQLNPTENFCAEKQSSTSPDVSKELLAKPGFTELSAAVTDSNGKEVIGLKPSDFIASTSAEPLPIAYFHESPEAPVTLGILIDTSGSMEPKLPMVRTVLANFITKINACDELFLIAFTVRPFLLQPMTTDHAAAANQLSLLHAFGQTSMYDSILEGLENLHHGHYTKKALLVITDGMDNTSQATLDEVTAVVRRLRLPIYIIGIGDPAVNAANAAGPMIGPLAFGAANNAGRGQGTFGGYINGVDAKALNELASSAGGQAFIVPPTRDNEFADAVASVQRQHSAPGIRSASSCPLPGFHLYSRSRRNPLASLPSNSPL